MIDFFFIVSLSLCDDAPPRRATRRRALLYKLLARNHHRSDALQAIGAV
jgi:hypothetical protein